MGKRFRGLLAAGVGIALMAGVVPVVAVAAEPPVMFTEAQLANALFAAAVRTKDTGVVFEKDVIASAELVDWRAKNPGEDGPAVTAHLHAVRSAMDKPLTGVQGVGQHAEVIRRITQVVYATPGAVITGARMTDLLAVLTGRDLFAGGVTSLSTLGRLQGAHQGLDLDAAFGKFASDVLAAVHDRAVGDATFAGAWRDTVGVAAAGQPFSLDPAAPSAILKALPVLRDQVNADAIVAQGALGQTAFYAEVNTQFTALKQKYDTVSAELNDKLAEAAASTSQPGAARTAPDPEKVSRAKADQANRQQTIDGLKGGLDFVLLMARYYDLGFGNQFTEYVVAAYKMTTEFNKLITAVTELATTTATGFAVAGYIGAALGAVAAILQIFGGLFGSNHGMDQAAIRAILAQMRNGFAVLQANLRSIAATMNSRFDRMDIMLKTILSQLQARFTDVLNAIEDVNADIADLHQQVISLQSQVQSFGERELAGIRDTNRDSFVQAVGQYVDYPHYNNGAGLPNYDQYYVPAVSNFLATAKQTARNNNFVFHDLTQGDAKTALTSTGPAGAIDWLANYANQNYGTTFTVASGDAMVPNTDLWAEAARAYYLTAMQNPNLAGQEGPAQARAADIIANGTMIRDRAAQFSKPPGSGSPLNNPLFNGLFNDYNGRLGNFLSAAEGQAYQEPVMKPGRHFNLWDDHPPNLTEAQFSQLPEAPGLLGGCNGDPTPAKPAPALGGRSLPWSWLVGLYVEPAWQFRVCYTNLTASAPQWTSTRNPDGSYHNSGWLNLTADFQQIVNGEIARIERATKDYSFKARCENNTPTPQQPSCPNPTPYLTDNQPWVATAETVPGDGGASRTRALFSDRRAKYYDLMANRTSLDLLPEGHALDNMLRVYRGYVDLGLPRAKQTDDQLRALLYGPHGLVSNVDTGQLLSSIYAQAARHERATHGAGPYPIDLLDDGTPGVDPALDCGAYRGAKLRDPIGVCLSDIAGQRNARLRTAVRNHLRNVANRTEVQTLPMIDEALANLQMVRQYITTVYPNGYPAPATVSAVQNHEQRRRATER